MKLTILGGGGFRVPLVYEAVARGATGLTVDDIVLHDVDADRLRTTAQVIEGLAAEIRSGAGPGGTAAGSAAGGRVRLPAVRTSMDLRDAVAGADFVFSAIRVGGAQARTIDERVALDLGLLGQETVGAGGLAYALRTIPAAINIAATIAEAAPEAWVINFTNPAGIVTEAMRGVHGHRVVGICDTPIGLVRRVGRLLGLDSIRDLERTSIDYVGLNHLGWLRSVTVDGVEQLGALFDDEDALDQIEEARLIGTDWVRADRALPNEYLYYYLHTGHAVSRILDAGTTRGEFLVQQQQAYYQRLSGTPPQGVGSSGQAADTAKGTPGSSPLAIWRAALHERESTYMAESRDDERREEDIAGGGYQEVALRLMTALAMNRPERMILDIGNTISARSTPAEATAGTSSVPETRVIPGLPAETVIEVPCIVDGDGVHPEPVAPVELDRLGLMARVRGAERLILKAATSGDQDSAWRGFATHPLVSSPELGRRLLDGYLHRDPHIARVLGRTALQ